MIRGVDTAATVSDTAAKQLKELGFDFVARYIVPPKGGLAWKALVESEAQAIREAGLAILPTWETTGNRARSGATAGRDDGKTAAERAKELGIPEGTIICFAVDYNPPKSDYAAITEYLCNASSTAAPYRLGVYAPSAIVRELRSLVPAYWWRTYAWNDGPVDADAYQTAYQDDSAAVAVRNQVGFAVDLDEAKSFQGMWVPENLVPEDLIWAREHDFLLDGQPEDAVTKAEMATILRRVYGWI